MAQQNPKITAATAHHDCDFREMLSRVGDKWSLLVIVMLEGMPRRRGRFSDVKRRIPGISQRMLTATLRHLERDGMLTRHVFAEVPPRVEYELTTLGRGLMDPVRGLVTWLQSNWATIRTARERFDVRAARSKPPARSLSTAAGPALVAGPRR
jgi:DNA-binding HxlR family transcriptional regulator